MRKVEAPARAGGSALTRPGVVRGLQRTMLLHEDDFPWLRRQGGCVGAGAPLGCYFHAITNCSAAATRAEHLQARAPRPAQLRPGPPQPALGGAGLRGRAGAGQGAGSRTHRAGRAGHRRRRLQL